MKKNIVIFIIIGLIIALGLFYGGLKYGEAHPIGRGVGQFNQAGFGGSNGGNRGGQAGRLGQNGGVATGQVLNKDDKSLTISLSSGGSKIVFYSASTSVMKTTAGTLNDLTNGQNVNVIGQTNSDGSISAQSIQIRPLYTTSR